MKRILLAVAVAGLASVPAFAADPTSCADFTAMDSAGQMGAMTAMQEAMKAEGTAVDETMTPDAMSAAAVTACGAHPDMMVGDAMKAAM